MKKSIKISLGGFAFNIDEDAYLNLDGYLNSLKVHLGNTPESAEIIHDIEERASELLSGKVKENESVTAEMVQNVIDTLGNPEQIAGDSDMQSNDASSKFSSSSLKKRLYRDPENAKIAGVAAGLGAYFNVDPLVFRIIFVILLFAKGFGLIAYLILWIALPKAETPRQKLEMRGETINLENLEKNLRKEYEEVKNNLNKHGASEVTKKSISLFSQFFLVLGRILVVFVKVIGIFIGVTLIGAALVALLATIASLFLGGMAIASIFPSFSGLSFGEFLGSTIDLGSFAWISVPVFLIIAIPLISLIYLGLRILFRFRSSDGVFGSVAAIAWILSVVTLAIVVFLQARSFTIREEVTETIQLVPSNQSTKTLFLTTQNEGKEEEVLKNEPINIDDYTLVMVDGEKMILGRPRVFIGKATGNDYEMIVERKARGATKSKAIGNAQKINIEYVFVDSTLSLSPYFSLPDNEKWRMQEIVITVNIPEGKRVKIDQTMEKLLGSDQEFCFAWPDEMVGKTWIMQKDRLTTNE